MLKILSILATSIMGIGNIIPIIENINTLDSKNISIIMEEEFIDCTYNNEKCSRENKKGDFFINISHSYPKNVYLTGHASTIQGWTIEGVKPVNLRFRESVNAEKLLKQEFEFSKGEDSDLIFNSSYGKKVEHNKLADGYTYSYYDKKYVDTGSVAQIENNTFEFQKYSTKNVGYLAKIGTTYVIEEHTNDCLLTIMFYLKVWIKGGSPTWPIFSNTVWPLGNRIYLSYVL